MDLSEDEEDMFSCGRCKAEFSKMEDFMSHKKSKACKRKTEIERLELSSGSIKGGHGKRRDLSESSTIELVEIAGDRIPANLFEDTNQDYEDNLVIDTDELKGVASKTTDPIKPSDCQFCNIQFKNVKDLICHFSEEHKIPEEKASIILKNVSSSDDISNIRGERNFSIVKKHQIVEINRTSPGHTVDKPSADSDCPEDIGNSNVEKGALMKGLGLSGSVTSQSLDNQSHSESSWSYECAICDIQFKSQGRLKTHFKSKSHKSKTALGEVLENTLSNKVSNADKGHSDVKENTLLKDTKQCEQDPDKTTEVKRPRRKICAVCKTDFPNQNELVKHILSAHPQPVREKRSRRVSLKLRMSINDQQDNDSETDDENNDFSSRNTGEGSDESRKCSCCGQIISGKAYTVHVRRCHNKQKYECVLCKHQSRERYDFNIHIDHHKVWWNMSTQPCGSVETSKDSTVDEKDKNQGETEREELFVEELEDTTLSEADLAALGLMPRNKVDEEKNKQGIQSEEHAYATLETEEEVEDLSGDIESSEDTVEEDDNDKKKGSSGSRLKCHPCNRWFHRSILPGHMLKKHNMKKVFQCRDVKCLSVFDVLDEFVKHIRTHSSKPMFQCGCTTCKKGNPDEVEIDYAAAIKRLKMKNYYKKLIYKCSTCWARFPSQVSLDKHQQLDSHHYPCEICNKVQSSKSQYRSHMLSHQQTHKFLCEHCGKGFRIQRDLIKHVASHSSEKPFACSKCGKRFVFKAKLDRHVTTVHSLVKPFVCTEQGCDKAFTRKDKLKDHMYTHSPTPPFTCSYCTKGFYRKDNLRDHEVYHTRQYKYKCNKCNKGFMRPKALSQHFNTDHPVQEESLKTARSIPQPVTQIDTTSLNNIHGQQAAKPASVEYSGYPQIPMDQQVLGQVSLPPAGQAFTMLPTLQRGSEIGKSSNLQGQTDINQSINTLVQILPQTPSDMTQVTVQSSPGLPVQIQTSSTSSQYKYTQEKLEQVTRQIQAMTQQLIVQQFGGDLMQSSVNTNNPM
ncbi:hypothetical protein HOLleu_11764 [Holothuria leucospilota]|uniref:C2H2-type domain-containing protein n=1 Tax=Holothuria leucospilota TaxID=206669 RepID=A0A9Q1CAE1_HOLLE|nr:hypothetical protein HOLleu_11764 [Holothuria leucospilota]